MQTYVNLYSVLYCTLYRAFVCTQRPISALAGYPLSLASCVTHCWWYMVAWWLVLYASASVLKCYLYYICVCVCVFMYIYIYIYIYGPGNSVGIATDYGLDDPGIESRWGRVFPPIQTGPGAHPATCKMGTGPFPGVKCGRSVLLTIHPLLVQPSWKSRATPLPTLWATPGL